MKVFIYATQILLKDTVHKLNFKHLFGGKKNNYWLYIFTCYFICPREYRANINSENYKCPIGMFNTRI